MADISDNMPVGDYTVDDGVPPCSQSPEPALYPFRFDGTGREYFRIWIVNVFLTIITLGIYGAWAKVRTRRYFYSNTVLAGHSFDFLGAPGAILKGNLIIGAGAIVYSLLNNFLPIYASYAAMVFYLIFPFLIYKSLRFNFRNTAYRNIRFHFLGSLMSSYKVYLFWPLLLPATLGLIFPYWAFRKKEYVLNNFAYGATKNIFKGGPGKFYRIYLAVLLLIPLIFIVTGFLIPLMAGLSGSTLPADATGTILKFMKFLPFLFGITFMAFYAFFRQYLYVRLNNYCFNQSSIGAATLESTMRVRRLTWIFFTNLLAIIFTVGLLAPWAKVRRTRYILENLSVRTSAGFDDFTASAEGDVSAIGDAATDVFDIAIGL